MTACEGLSKKCAPSPGRGEDGAEGPGWCVFRFGHSDGVLLDVEEEACMSIDDVGDEAELLGGVMMGPKRVAGWIPSAF